MYPERVPSSQPPTERQLEIAAACGAASNEKIGRRFGITGMRVAVIRKQVDAYAKWREACASEVDLPRDNRRVVFIPMSTRTRNVLRTGGIVTVGEMARLTQPDVLAMTGAGKTAWVEIESYLASN